METPTPPAQPAEPVASAEIGEPVAAPEAKPFEQWIEKHPEIDRFYVAFARGAYSWAQGREMTEAAFLDAIERGKGAKMHASVPPEMIKGFKPAK